MWIVQVLKPQLSTAVQYSAVQYLCANILPTEQTGPYLVYWQLSAPNKAPNIDSNGSIGGYPGRCPVRPSYDLLYCI